MRNDTEELWKIWKGIDLSFQNWHKEFDEFWIAHWKVSKIYTFMSWFWPKYTIFDLKKYRGDIFHKEFDEFWPEHSKISKICTLIGCFWPKHIMLELKKV